MSGIFFAPYFTQLSPLKIGKKALESAEKSARLQKAAAILLWNQKNVVSLHRKKRKAQHNRGVAQSG